MKKAILSILLSLVMICTFLPISAGADAPAGGANSISTFADLQAAFENGTGAYILANDIIVSEGLTLNSEKTLTIDGDGHTIQPAVTGINEQGLVNADATAIANIITNSGTLTLRGLTIYGGQGRCISNTGTLTMNNVSLERAHLTGANNYGAGLRNNGSNATAILTDCNIRRNGCDNASGGFRNYNGTLIMENCAIVENRNFGSMKGGGGGENQGTLYMNNCTVANNQSSEIGGGLNNYEGTAYIMNSTFTGNVSTDTRISCGGGIGNNGGTVYAVNSVFAFNYANGQVSDIGCFSGGPGKIFLYHCAYGQIINGSSSVSYATTDNNCKALETTDTPATVFNGVRNSGVVDMNGTESTSNRFARPVITPVDGTYGVYPAEDSTLKSGVITYYKWTNSTVLMGYAKGDGSIAPLGSDTTTTLTQSDSVKRPYNNTQTTNDVIGAWPAPTSSISTTMYTVTVKPATGGTVTGGSAQGNSYPANTTNIQITATPNTGYTFSGWLVGDETTPSVTTTTYTINILSNDITLTPVFVEGEATPVEPTVKIVYDNGSDIIGTTVTVGDNLKAVLTNIPTGATYAWELKELSEAGTPATVGTTVTYTVKDSDVGKWLSFVVYNNSQFVIGSSSFEVVAADTPPAPPADEVAPSAPAHEPIRRQNANTTTVTTPDSTTSATVTSPKTGDMGIAVYAALSIMSMTGSAWIVGTKRRH